MRTRCLLSLRQQLLAKEAAPAAGSSLLLDLQRLLASHLQLEQLQATTTDRQYATSARRVARPAPAAAAAAARTVFGADLPDEDEPAPELSLPDLSTLGAINPRLRDVILQHQSLQKSSTAVETIMAAVDAAQPDAKRAQRLTKTGVSRLRVDALRDLLQRLGGDSRGTKEALVQRVMEVAGAEERARLAREQQQGVAAAAAAAAVQLDDAPSEGVVSRRHLAAQAKVAQRLAAAAARGGSYGVPDASLRQSHRDMVQQGAEYASIFSPHEVADILAEARADDIAIIDVRGRCPFTDWMVLATARSQRLAHMLAGAVLHALKARAKEVAPGVAPTIEGAQDDSEWLVVDAGSVVTHVFLEGHRQEYGLEELWGAAGGSNITRVAPKATLHTLDSLQ